MPVGAIAMTAASMLLTNKDAVPKIVGFIKNLFQKSDDPERDFKAAMSVEEQKAADERERERIRQYTERGLEYIKHFYANLPEDVPDYIRNMGPVRLETALKHIKMYKYLKGKGHEWDNVKPSGFVGTEIAGNVYGGINPKVEPQAIAGNTKTLDGVMAWVKNNPVISGVATIVAFLLFSRKKLF